MYVCVCVREIDKICKGGDRGKRRDICEIDRYIYIYIYIYIERERERGRCEVRERKKM